MDRLELSEAATRGAGATDDPAIPIHSTGIVGPAGALNLQVLDDFDDNNLFFFFRDALFIGKWSSPNLIALLYEKTSIPSTNVIVAAALTRAGPNVIVTARVLDRQKPNAVLCEGSVVDTPGRDASLTTAEVRALSGLQVSFNPDVIGAPFSRGDSFLIGCCQYTDGTLPPAEVTFDNLEMRTYDVPLLAIDKAVCVHWPASAFPLTVEGAPAVQGPWLPVLQPVLESASVKQVVVPDSEAMRFFRLK